MSIEEQESLIKLKKLLELVEKLPLDRIDMWTFADPGFDPHDCDTQACLGGWANTIFPELKLIYNNGRHCSISYNESFGFYALAVFFGISEKDAEYLFNGEFNKEEAISNLRDYIGD